jgi:dihydrodipicolinate synthase/N-acetylneuraminate lyase
LIAFKGVIPVLQTPFLEDGSLDLDSLSAEVEYAIEAGVAGMVFPGFVSEWWKLTSDEIDVCAQRITQTARGRVPVILNVTAQSTYVAVQQARHFASLGADGLMCLPPFVVPRSSDALVTHLAAVLEAVDRPHILQYSASLTGIHLEGRELSALHDKYPHLGCIKVDFIPPGPAITRLRRVLPESFTYLIGFAGLQMPDALARGAHGVMGGTGHVREDLAVWSSLLREPSGEGFDRFRSLLPLLNSEMQTVDLSIATHKWLLKRQGVFRSAHVRVPGAELDEYQTVELMRHWEQARSDLGIT